MQAVVGEYLCIVTEGGAGGAFTQALESPIIKKNCMKRYFSIAVVLLMV